MKNFSEKEGREREGKCTDFDEILNKIGSEGRYQKILVYGFTGLVAACSPFLMFSNVFLLDTPDHWCKPDSKEPLTGPALDLWKNESLPMELGASGFLEFSKCEMYDPNSKNTTIRCPGGWEFDRSNYYSTIPTEYNWVCGQDTYPTDAFTWGIAGGAIGTIVFGSLADKIGRLPVMVVASFINLIFRAAALFVPHRIGLFHACQFLMGLAFPTMYTVILVICSEICGVKYRSWSYTVMWASWVFGNCLLPLTFWLIGEWFAFGLVSLVPGVLVIAMLVILKESPRWLISVGKTEKAFRIIKTIAKTNGVKINEKELKEMIGEIQEHNELVNEGKSRNIGAWTLFQKWRLAMNTICLTVALTMSNTLYYGVTLNVSNLVGNMYLNYFLLAICELPASFLAGFLMERTGRRWTQTVLFLFCLVSCAMGAIGAGYPNLSILGLLGGIGVKFGVSITSLVALLQCSELFPTSLRSTGTSVVSTVMMIVGIAGPYIVFTSNINVLYPYLIFIGLSTLGIFSSAILPETYNQNLPETVEDANNFGKGVKFWSYLPKRKENKVRGYDNPGMVMH